MPNPRYKIHVEGPVGNAVVQWIYALIPVLRAAPRSVEVEVRIRNEEENS